MVGIHDVIFFYISDLASDICVLNVFKTKLLKYKQYIFRFFKCLKTLHFIVIVRIKFLT